MAELRDGETPGAPAAEAPPLLYRCEAELVDVRVVGRVRGGLRIDARTAGDVAGGRLAGATCEGIHHLLLRFDGTGVVDARERVVLPGGEGELAVRASGYLVPADGPAPEPRPAASAFSWPPRPCALHGSATIRPLAGDISALARTLLPLTGLLDVGARRLITEG